MNFHQNVTQNHQNVFYFTITKLLYLVTKIIYLITKSMFLLKTNNIKNRRLTATMNSYCLCRMVLEGRTLFLIFHMCHVQSSLRCKIFVQIDQED